MRRNAKFLLLIVSCLMTVDSLQRNDYNIVNRPKNGNETVDNIKVVFIDSFKQLQVANHVDTSQIKLHAYCKNGFGLHTEEALFVSSDDLGNISILLDEDNDLEEEITHLFNEVSIFIFNFEKNPTTNQALNILKTCFVIRDDNFKRFQVCFLVQQQYGLVCKHTIFSTNKESMVLRKCLPY